MPIHAVVCIGLFCLAGLYSHPSILFHKTDPSAASPSNPSVASPSDTSAASPSETSAVSPLDPSATSPQGINTDITPPVIKDSTSDAGVSSKLWRSANYPAILLRLLPANAASVAMKALLDCLIFGLALPWYYYFTGFIVQSIMTLFARFALNTDTPDSENITLFAAFRRINVRGK